MMGIDKISLKDSFQLYINIDDDYILETWSNSGIPSLRVVYLTIGEKSNKVCSRCNNFIYRDSCLDSCPFENTYPYEGYEIGGKSCLTCSLKVFERLRDDRTGCECVDGTARNSLGICSKIDPNLIIPDPNETLTPNEICGDNQVNINGLCVCDDRSVPL